MSQETAPCGAPRTVPSSSGHKTTVLVAALSRTRLGASSFCRHARVFCLQANQGRPYKKATQRRPFEAALVSVPFVVTPGLPVSRQTRAGLIIKATQRRLLEAALVSVPFVVIHGLPVFRQTRADLIIKATQGRLLKAASESAIERIELGPTRQIPPGLWPPSVRLCGSNWGWLFPRSPWGCTSALGVVVSSLHPPSAMAGFLPFSCRAADMGNLFDLLGLD